MLNEEGKPKTSHTTNKVPFVMANAPVGWSLKKTDGVLGDVAPTVLAAMGLEQPKEMTGTCKSPSSILGSSQGPRRYFFSSKHLLTFSLTQPC